MKKDRHTVKFTTVVMCPDPDSPEEIGLEPDASQDKYFAAWIARIEGSWVEASLIHAGREMTAQEWGEARESLAQEIARFPDAWRAAAMQALAEASARQSWPGTYDRQSTPASQTADSATVNEVGVRFDFNGRQLFGKPDAGKRSQPNR